MRMLWSQKPGSSALHQIIPSGTSWEREKKMSCNILWVLFDLNKEGKKERTALDGGKVSFNLTLGAQGFLVCLLVCLKQTVLKAVYLCPSNFSATHRDFGNVSLNSFVMICLCSLNLQNDRSFSYVLRYSNIAPPKGPYINE